MATGTLQSPKAAPAPPMLPLGLSSRGGTCAVQRGLGPEFWGISLDQLTEITRDPRHSNGMTTREVVDKIIIPETAGTGASYALLKNPRQPLRAALFVSHAWDERFAGLAGALATCGEPGPFWVSATALYQPEDARECGARRQSGAEIGGLLTAVLQQAAAVLCVLSTDCNVYTRLWCLFEMSMAMHIGVQVRAIRKHSGFGWGFVDEALIKACSQPVDSLKARCADIEDEKALRTAIDTSLGGHEAVDRAVEEARLAALLQGRDRLLGGGWKETGIGRNYVDVIDQVCLRLGRMVPSAHEPHGNGTMTPPGPRAMSPNSVGIRSGLGGVVQPSPPLSLIRGLPTVTPRSATRRHWASATPS